MNDYNLKGKDSYMKKILVLILALILSLTFLTACGEDEVVVPDTTVWATNAPVFPAVPAELLTEEAYQFITVAENSYVYKIAGYSSLRSFRFTPTAGTVTVTVDLTSSSKSSTHTTISLWETNGEDLVFLKEARAESVYSVEDGGSAEDTVYTHTFSELDPAKTYRVVLSPFRGTITGQIAIQDVALFNDTAVDAAADE